MKITNKNKVKVISFIYAYNTIDIEEIKENIPEASDLKQEELDVIIREDYEKIDREIRYS